MKNTFVWITDVLFLTTITVLFWLLIPMTSLFWGKKFLYKA